MFKLVNLRNIFLCLSLCMLMTRHTLVAGTDVDILLQRGPYLQLGTATSIFIKWRTNIPCNSSVRYGTSPSNLNSVVTSSAIVLDHEINLSALTPDTKYYYRIESCSKVLQGDSGNYFITAPLTGTPKKTRIWVIGDAGSNTAEQNQVRDAYYAYTGTTHTDVWLWMGDNAYQSGLDIEYQIDVFANHYEKMLKSTVAWPTPGNHDFANLGYQSFISRTNIFAYFSIFKLPANAEAGGVPSGTEHYYSFNYANIHFISLDSYGSFNDPASAMYNWLKNDLAANTQPWTIVYMHHPPYSKGSHDSDVEVELINMRTNIVPLLEQYKVDLVLSGHSHGYERSYLIHGHYGTENTFTDSMKVDSGSGMLPAPYIKKAPAYKGTVYSVVGCSGKLGGTSPGYPYNAMYYSVNTKYGSMSIDVEDSMLTARFIDKDRVVLDEFTIKKDTNSVQASLPVSTAAAGTVFTEEAERLSVAPNPYSDETTISYVIAQDRKVSLKVYNKDGVLVKTIVPGFFQKAGKYSYTFSARREGFSSGVYLIKLMLDDKVYTEKAIERD